MLAQYLRVSQELKSFHFNRIKLVPPKGGFACAYSEQVVIIVVCNYTKFNYIQSMGAETFDFDL